MSGGRAGGTEFSKAELDDLLEEALANPKVKRALARPFRLDTSYDVALLGSSSIDGKTVYLDRHLSYPGKPFGILPLQKRWLDVKPPLIRHERLEQVLENIMGWPYLPLAHPVAERWEEQLVAKLDFDVKGYEKMLAPYIKGAEHGKMKRVPTDVDKRPLMFNAEPEDKAIFKHYHDTANKEKKTQASVGYVGKSKAHGQQCSKCQMYITKTYSDMVGCTLVRDPIAPGGWCRRFVAGKLESK